MRPVPGAGPTIDKLADKYAGKVKVGKLNVDEAQDTAATYGVSSIPLVMLFNGSASRSIRPWASAAKTSTTK